ncbi:DUF6506 family protein [Georgenia sp. Z1344]|uniref:DUF6506 family protein n=1 Tax=Georgenia sp. Z1344 TaxID=3416706 RepID=UPI003CF78954
MEPTAVLYEGTPGARLSTPSLTVVGAEASDVVTEALRLAGEGWTRLELCGGLPVDVASEVLDALATEEREEPVRVGLNRYGFESLELVADFKRAFDRGEAAPQVFLVPARREVARVEHADVTIIPVGSLRETEGLAGDLAATGVGMIELYGGLGTDHAAAVWRGSGGRIPVGFVGYDD